MSASVSGYRFSPPVPRGDRSPNDSSSFATSGVTPPRRQSSSTSIHLDAVGEPARTAALPLLRARRVELVADHAERQELVALEPEDLLEALEVGGAEQAVAALGPPWREQALVLEVPDLRDRDVRELLAEAAHDLADPEQALALGLPRNGAHRRAVLASTKLRRYFPICSSSPFSRFAVSIRLRFTNVPFSDP